MTYQEMADKANKVFGYIEDREHEAILAEDVQAFLERHDRTYLDGSEARYIEELADDGA